MLTKDHLPTARPAQWQGHRQYTRRGEQIFDTQFATAPALFDMNRSPLGAGNERKFCRDMLSCLMRFL